MGTEATKPADEPLRDQMGVLVPEHLTGTWEADMALAASARSHLVKADNLAKKYADSYCGLAYFHGLSLQGFQERLRAAKKSLRACLPIVCVECPGLGCTACNGSGLRLQAQLDEDGITEAQAKVLAERGIETEGLSKKEASRKIDDIAGKENWQPKEKTKQPPRFTRRPK